MEKIQTIETFRDIRGYYLKELENVKPNGINYLSYKKYKVTVEELEESCEVYKQRLQEIYDEKHSGFKIKLAVLNEAKKIGVVIKEK